MTDLKGKVAIVTGASSGIGSAITKTLLQLGMKVVGAARRIERIEELRKGYKEKLFAVKTDLSNEEDIQNAVKWTETNVGPIDVLINNAGVSVLGPLSEMEIEGMKSVLNTNLLGLTIFTREVIRSMKANNINGTIINITSIAGHYIVPIPGASIYTASKFGVRAFTEAMRIELAHSGSKIRITSLSPGLVRSEMTSPMGDYLDISPHLQAEDVAESVRYVLTLPPNVNIAELTIRPIGEKV